MIKTFALGAIVPLFVIMCLTGCQSAQEKANASETATPTISKPPVTAADSIVVAGKAAFEGNKCGTCHSVGEYAAAKAPAKKRDLSGVGLTHSAAWVTGFLQKKEKLNDKLHMKGFTGTAKELAELSNWLVTQKVAPKT